MGNEELKKEVAGRFDSIFRADLGLTQRRAAGMLKLSGQGAYWMYASGTRILTYALIVFVYDLGYSLDWLFIGQGSKHRGKGAVTTLIEAVGKEGVRED